MSLSWSLSLGFWENGCFVHSSGQMWFLKWVFPGFGGVIRSVKVVSVFRFGDRKCRFRDIAICQHLLNPPFSRLTSYVNSPWITACLVFTLHFLFHCYCVGLLLFGGLIIVIVFWFALLRSLFFVILLDFYKSHISWTSDYSSQMPWEPGRWVKFWGKTCLEFFLRILINCHRWDLNW